MASGEETARFRSFIGGPCDGQMQSHKTTRWPLMIGRPHDANLEFVSVYEYQEERQSAAGVELVYRFAFTARRDESLEFMKQNQKWLGTP